jgi:hypothetical protein
MERIMNMNPIHGGILGLACLVGLAAAPRLAVADDLSTKATNPIGDLIQVQLQYQHGSDIYDLDGDSDAAIVQPVIPFDLPWESVPKIITRTTIPAYVSTPDLPGSGSVDGFGDTVFLGFLMPKLETKGIMFGIGPALGLPTASEDETGTDAWSLGPAAVYVNLQTKGWMWGVLAYGLWDVAGDDDRDDVSQVFIQPLLFKFFSDGWYLGLQDITWTYDDETEDWFLPIGPRLGKTTKIGSQPVNIYTGVYYNPVDTTGTAKWIFKLSLSLLFPN